MNHEEARGLLDQLIDDELSADQAREVREHIAECDDCKSEARSIKILSLALGSIPEEKLRDDERDRLVSAAEAAAAKSKRRVPVFVWLATAAIVLVVAAIAVPLVFSKSQKPQAAQPAAEPQGSAAVGTGRPPSAAVQSDTANGPAPQPVIVDKGRSYSDPAQVDQAFRANPQAVAFLGYYSASDVGALQRQMQEDVSLSAPKVAGHSAAECMNIVFRSVPRPVLPAYIERAKFDGTDAWAIVFAYAPEVTPDARLSGELVYVLSTADCLPLASATYT